MFRVINNSPFYNWHKDFNDIEEALKYAELVKYVCLWGCSIIDEYGNTLVEYKN